MSKVNGKGSWILAYIFFILVFRKMEKKLNPRSLEEKKKVKKIQTIFKQVRRTKSKIVQLMRRTFLKERNQKHL